jgi:hypothetical protein
MLVFHVFLGPNSFFLFCKVTCAFLDSLHDYEYFSLRNHDRSAIFWGKKVGICVTIVNSISGEKF